MSAANDTSFGPRDRTYLDEQGNPRLARSVLLFGDLLGVSSMALSPDASRHLAALDHIVNHEELVKSLDSGGLWSVGLASDSIVVATPLHEYGGTARDVMRLLAGVAARLQIRLMQRGFFLRGALAIGDLHFYGNRCFGPALVEGHSREDICASSSNCTLPSH
jgi:hypothetical protein